MFRFESKPHITANMQINGRKFVYAFNYESTEIILTKITFSTFSEDINPPPNLTELHEFWTDGLSQPIVGHRRTIAVSTQGAFYLRGNRCH